MRYSGSIVACTGMAKVTISTPPTMAVNLDFLYTTPNAAIEPTRTCSSTATTVTISVLTNARMMVPSAKASL